MTDELDDALEGCYRSCSLSPCLFFFIIYFFIIFFFSELAIACKAESEHGAPPVASVGPSAKAAPKYG